MNRILRTRWFALALVLAVVLPLAAAAQEPDVTFHNDTGFYIDEFYFSWAQSDDWGEDMLPGRQALPPGEALLLYTGGHCWWDIMLVLVDGNGDRFQYELDKSFNFCAITDIVFSCDQNGCRWYAE